MDSHQILLGRLSGLGRRHLAKRIGRVVEYVAKETNVPAETILGHRRYPDVVQARRLAICACRDAMGLSYPDLGRAFNKDHTVAMDSVKEIQYQLGRVDRYGATRDAYGRVMSKVNKGEMVK